MMPPPAAPARGQRVPWSALPPELRAWAASVLGGALAAVGNRPGGFSPGAAVRLRTRSGRRGFLKAVSATANPDSPQMHRQEADVTARLPADLPVPRLLGSYDDGEWVALLLDDIPGRHPRLPWRPGELRRVLAAIEDLSRRLTPSPLPDLPAVTEAYARQFTGWRRLAADPPRRLPPWVRRHLDRLADLEPGWAAAAAGDTLLHTDLRADNMLVTAERVWMLDWPAACHGHPLLDLVVFLPSALMQGAPPADRLLSWTSYAGRPDPDRLRPLVCALAGYFVAGSFEPPPPGLPTLRAFQAAQGRPAVAWLRDLTGWR